MISRLLALTITAAVALGVAGSVSAQTTVNVGENVTSPRVQNNKAGERLGPRYTWSLLSGTGTWDMTYTYGVNGTKRTCTLTRGAKCVGAKLRGRVKHHGDLRKANLRRADLRFADLRGANLQGADLRSANLKYADLRGANLKGAKLQYAPPVHGKKAERGSKYTTPPCVPNCVGADLTYAYLGGADFTDAYLSYAYLIHANLTNANLTNAYLTGANLSYARLWGANLTNANLVYANPYSADLTRANLDDANLTHANLDGVTWSNTICPDRTVTSTGCAT